MSVCLRSALDATYTEFPSFMGYLNIDAIGTLHCIYDAPIPPTENPCYVEDVDGCFFRYIMRIAVQRTAALRIHSCFFSTADRTSLPRGDYNGFEFGVVEGTTYMHTPTHLRDPFCRLNWAPRNSKEIMAGSSTRLLVKENGRSSSRIA